MFMSMFSSFDAFNAESLGRKVSFSCPSVVSLKKEDKLLPGSTSPGSQGSDQGAGTTDVTTGYKGKGGNKKPEVKQRPQRNPRFAVELDGIHCFETIIPY